MEKDKLVIFDLDGTLFDTKKVNFKAYNYAIQKIGISKRIDYMYYCQYCNGMDYRFFLPIIIPDISKEQIEAIHNEKQKKYKDFLLYAKKNEGLFSLIKVLRQEYWVSVVTTASRMNTMDILKFFEVDWLFDFILTKEDVTETKPSAEGFLKAMELANVVKEKTIIFEDSNDGLRAAELAGAKYVKVCGYN